MILRYEYRPCDEPHIQARARFVGLVIVGLCRVRALQAACMHVQQRTRGRTEQCAGSALARTSTRERAARSCWTRLAYSRTSLQCRSLTERTALHPTSKLQKRFTATGASSADLSQVVSDIRKTSSVTSSLQWTVTLSSDSNRFVTRLTQRGYKWHVVIPAGMQCYCHWYTQRPHKRSRQETYRQPCRRRHLPPCKRMHSFRTSRCRTENVRK